MTTCRQTYGLWQHSSPRTSRPRATARCANLPRRVHAALPLRFNNQPADIIPGLADLPRRRHARSSPFGSITTFLDASLQDLVREAADPRAQRARSSLPAPPDRGHGRGAAMRRAAARSADRPRSMPSRFTPRSRKGSPWREFAAAGQPDRSDRAPVLHLAEHLASVVPPTASMRRPRSARIRAAAHLVRQARPGR